MGVEQVEQARKVIESVAGAVFSGSSQMEL